MVDSGIHIAGVEGERAHYFRDGDGASESLEVGVKGNSASVT